MTEKKAYTQEEHDRIIATLKEAGWTEMDGCTGWHRPTFAVNENGNVVGYQLSPVASVEARNADNGLKGVVNHVMETENIANKLSMQIAALENENKQLYLRLKVQDELLASALCNIANLEIHYLDLANDRYDESMENRYKEIKAIEKRVETIETTIDPIQLIAIKGGLTGFMTIVQDLRTKVEKLEARWCKLANALDEE